LCSNVQQEEQKIIHIIILNSTSNLQIASRSGDIKNLALNRKIISAATATASKLLLFLKEGGTLFIN